MMMRRTLAPYFMNGQSERPTICIEINVVSHLNPKWLGRVVVESIVTMNSVGGEFRFLKRLILVHGRYSYNRTAFMSQYSFYKSLLICFIQIFLLDAVSLMAYNVFYTSIPVLVSLVDKDLSEGTVMQHPQILYYCQAGRLLNPRTFAGWFGRSLFHVSTVHFFLFHQSISIAV
ncbi:hypothetical protein CsSME_00019729 [Camellia sinensis var. sinensis]